jgi:hypothetical protein
MVGHWDFTGKVFDENSGAEPLKLEGSVENRFLGESAWVVATGKGRAGNDSYEIVSIMCFDAETQKFVATGANSAFPPKLVLDEGTYDESSKTISWKEQEILEPGSGKKATVKGEDTFKSENTFVSIAYIKRHGSDRYVKWVETINNRRAGGTGP